MNGTDGPGAGRRPDQPSARGRPDGRGSSSGLRVIVVYVREHWLITLILLLVIAVLAIRFLRRPAGEEDAGAPAVVTATTAVARVGDFAVTIDALGTVQPRPGSFAQVAAPAASRVSRIMVATGDRVRAGQALVQLDESVWALQAQQARVGMDAAQKAYDRAERLFQEGISPRKDVESAGSDLAKARADLEAARRTQSLGTLRSPISGVVTELNASLSQPVDVNQPLVEVVDPAGLEVLFHLSPTDASRVAAGGAVEMTAGGETAGAGTSPAGAAAAPAQFLGRGTITGVSAAVDSATGSVTVRAAVASSGVALKAGQTVTGHIVVAHHPRVVVVPASALVPAGEGLQVFVVDARGVAHATPVTVGARSSLEAEIVSGLHGGETVVTGGAYGVTDSATIKAPGKPEGPGQ